MNEQTLLAQYEREALHKYAQERAPSPTDTNTRPAAGNTNGGFLSRVDWHLVFTVSANAFSVLSVLYLAYCYRLYFQIFGVDALAMVGLFLVGVFFLLAVMSATDDGQVLLSCFGLFLLINIF